VIVGKADDGDRENEGTHFANGFREGRKEGKKDAMTNFLNV